MMLEAPCGSTPLTHEDLEGLIPTYLSTREDLNHVEAKNISRAHRLFMMNHTKYSDRNYLLDDLTVRKIHEAMFGDVWKWAGSYRTRETNIGIAPSLIGVEARELVLNARERIEHCDTSDQYTCDRLCIWFHWKLVYIHPFANGNGRHSRMMADLLISALGFPVFEWGPYDLDHDCEGRSRYITALRKADDTRGDIDDLYLFARSAN